MLFSIEIFTIFFLFQPIFSLCCCFYLKKSSHSNNEDDRKMDKKNYAYTENKNKNSLDDADNGKYLVTVARNVWKYQTFLTNYSYEFGTLHFTFHCIEGTLMDICICTRISRISRVAVTSIVWHVSIRHSKSKYSPTKSKSMFTWKLTH